MFRVIARARPWPEAVARWDRDTASADLLPFWHGLAAQDDLDLEAVLAVAPRLRLAVGSLVGKPAPRARRPGHDRHAET
jgi:hypothetical protein